MPGQADFDTLLRHASEAIGRGDWTAAEAALGACLEQRPGEASIAYNLALVEKKLAKTNDAERRLAALLEIAPHHSNARFEYAASLMDRGAEAEALAEFETCLAADPDDPDARLNAARLCLRLERAGDALAHIEAAGKSRCDDPAIGLVRAEALRDLGRVDEARTLFGALYRKAPGLRPAIVKAMSQGRAGRIPLRASRMHEKPC